MSPRCFLAISELCPIRKAALKAEQRRADDDPLLSGIAKKLIEDPSNRNFVSVATRWEIAIKVGLKKLDLGEPAATFLPWELAANHFNLLEIELRHATF